jgi:hypothetical protein
MHKDLADHILPYRGRFTLTEGNRGDRRNQKIINSTATKAAGVLRSGMMAGITSPARPWKRLSTPDPELADFGGVKRYLHTVDQRMNTVFLRSNLYNTLPIAYGDLGVFATAPIFIEEDFDTVIRTQSFPIGSYRIAKDFRGRVNVFFREFRMTVRQLVSMFGVKDAKGKPDWSVFSRSVRDHYQKGNYETWVTVCHLIEPNAEYYQSSPLAKNKKFISCYYEQGAGQAGEENLSLRESGYDYFPVLCPRWETTGEDVYGTSCPGIVTIGDIKQLQLMEKRSAQSIELMNKPPMVGPTALKNGRSSSLPGDITYDDSPANAGFRPAFQIQPQIQPLEMKIEKIERRIQDGFYENMFLMLANDTRSNVTAREIEERHEEKLLALGPVLEQLNQDLLDPLIDITFDIMNRQGMLPEPPEELQDSDLKVEYISIMAQAQRSLGIGSLERLVGGITQAAAINQLGVRKFNLDQYIDVYAEHLGTAPSIIRSDEEVAAMAEQEAQAQAAEQEAAMIQAGAGAAKDLAGADMSGDNALTQLISQAEAGQLVGGG